MQKIIEIVKYVISGGTAAVVDLVFLYIFTDGLKMWYLLSAILAFLIAFIVSFLMQKFWTFKDASTEKVHRQAVIYFIVSSVNFGLNTLLVYIFTDLISIHYLMSQILASGLLAISSYFIYSIFIFKNPPLEAENPNNSQ